MIIFINSYLMRQNAMREKMNKEKQAANEVIIGNNRVNPETPKLVHTVIQVYL